MRIARIDLIRWGKFTDKVIELPKSECDFHLIVGANEAGKSTLREAISDLLYGVPKFTPFSFFHARSELRLAATLEHAGKSLVFHRTSGTKSPLRDTDDNPLVDEALAPFVGATGREFFEQMFGLDHARLVEGSQRFLSPNDSVGAKLFEAASGMASVSQMRDALEADAKDIVSRSKASELAEARAQLKQAQDALKQATVRTRDWSQAEDEFVRLEKALAELRQRKEALATEQNQLLRVQRVAPHLSAWADARTALTELEDAVELPADAAAILASAQTELSKASAEFGIHAEHMKRAAESIAAITLDEPVLAVADDIVALEESRQRFATHTRDIDLRQRELDTEWELARRRAVELGWTLTDEGSLVAALPDPITRKRLDTLARGCEALKTKADGARRARDSTKEDIADAQSALKNLTVLQLPGGFRPALASAQGAIQSASQFDEAHALVERRRAALEKARVALGEWVAGEEILRAMVLPAESEVDATAQALKDAHSGVATCERELRDCDSDLAAKKLAIEQHSQAHSPVTHEEVGQLRESRDGVWRAIRDGQTQLSDGAAEYEGLVVQADDAADRRQATANESATLQSMRREEQSLELKRDDATRRLEQAKTELARQGDAWQDRAAGLGLAGLALDAAAGWMRQREACLAAFDGLHEAQLNLEQMQRQRAQIRDSLTQLLDQAGQAADSNAELPVLAEAAQDLVARADHASGERKKTEELLEKARGLLQRQEKEFDEATVSRDEWQRDWAAVLESAKLDAQTRPEDA
ncbi:MAG: AAA family ATPase, partial [Burkholderiaceae bacterium]|nr:AAA family ATPase [Burkholderiaceae bacterium]